MVGPCGHFGGFDGINLFDYSSQPALAADAAGWQDIDFDGALDSGCVEHVCAQIDVPQYVVEPSAGSRAGQGFVVGNGDHLPNKGQATLNLEATDGDGAVNEIKPCFQIAQVTRPLMSVSKVCDHGYRCLVDKDKAIVTDSKGRTVCTFVRR